MAVFQTYEEYMVNNGFAYYHYKGRGYYVGEFCTIAMENGIARKALRKAKRRMRCRYVNTELVYNNYGMPTSTKLYVCKASEMQVPTKRPYRLPDKFKDKVTDFKNWCIAFKEM